MTTSGRTMCVKIMTILFYFYLAPFIGSTGRSGVLPSNMDPRFLGWEDSQGCGSCEIARLRAYETPRRHILVEMN